MSTPEENKALILRAYDEIWSRGNLDAIDEIVSADCEAYSPQNPTEPMGIEAARQGVAAARSAFRTWFAPPKRWSPRAIR